MADEVAEVRRRLDLVELIGQRVALKQAGKRWRGLCPFHEDRNPSFDVDPRTGYYRCWSCGAKGDCFNWVMETQRVDFGEALKILAKLTGVSLAERRKGDPSLREAHEGAMAEALAYFRGHLKSDSAAKAYVESRGLDEQTIQAWELGFAPEADGSLAAHLKKKGVSLAEAKKLYLVEADPSGGFFDRFRGRLMFPIRDERGALVAFGGRILGPGQPKYINSSDTPLYSKSRVLYGMHRAKEAMASTKTAVLVEGYLDVIACHRAEVTNAVASLGTSLAEDQVKLLRRWCENVVILYDADAAGEKASDRASEMLQAAGLKVKVALMPPGEDPDTLLREKGAAAVQSAVAGASLSPMEFKLRKLRQDFKPDEDSYWTQVVPILAGATDPLEYERHLHQVAAEYPGIPDRMAAKEALRRMVAKARRAAKSQAPAPDAAPIKVKSEPKKLPSAEREVLRGFLNPTTLTMSLDAVDEGLFYTPDGKAAAAAVAEWFASSAAHPDEPIWVQELEPESARDLMTTLAWQEDAPAPPEFVLDAIAKLRREKEARAAEDLKPRALDDDEALRDLQERIKKPRADHRPKKEE